MAYIRRRVCTRKKQFSCTSYLLCSLFAVKGIRNLYIFLQHKQHNTDVISCIGKIMTNESKIARIT